VGRSNEREKAAPNRPRSRSSLFHSSHTRPRRSACTTTSAGTSAAARRCTTWRRPSPPPEKGRVGRAVRARRCVRMCVCVSYLDSAGRRAPHTRPAVALWQLLGSRRDDARCPCPAPSVVRRRASSIRRAKQQRGWLRPSLFRRHPSAPLMDAAPAQPEQRPPPERPQKPGGGKTASTRWRRLRPSGAPARGRRRRRAHSVIAPPPRHRSIQSSDADAAACAAAAAAHTRPRRPTVHTRKAHAPPRPQLARTHDSEEGKKKKMALPFKPEELAGLAKHIIFTKNDE